MPRLRPLPNSEADGTAKPARINSRGRLNAHFIEALAADFEQHGAEALERVRQQSPEKYCSLAADLIPKQLEVQDANPFAKVQTLEELKPTFIQAIVDYGWVDDVLALAASRSKEIKVIEASENAA